MRESGLRIDDTNSGPFLKFVFLSYQLGGGGTLYDLLAGIPSESISRSKSAANPRKTVRTLNATYARTDSARETLINPIPLRANSCTGGAFIDQDNRLAKTFKIGERIGAKFGAECSNVFCYGNLWFEGGGRDY
jgi:hypothetical protein